VAIVIAHFDADRRKYVVDLGKRDLTIAEAAGHLKRYWITEVTGLVSENYDENGLGEALAGVIYELSREHPL
jgi:hypothetical protein